MNCSGAGIAPAVWLAALPRHSYIVSSGNATNDRRIDNESERQATVVGAAHRSRSVTSRLYSEWRLAADLELRHIFQDIKA